MITLQCPSCGGRTRFAADAERFVCDYCGNEHLFNLPIRGVAPPSPLEPSRRPLMPQPGGVTVEMLDDGLELTWRWFSWKYIPLALFCVVWDGFLCFWYSIALSTDAPWIMIVFPIFHLAVGVGLTYSVLAGFLNHSTLRVDRKIFSIQHDPVPWLGEVKVPLGDLDQLYCKEKRGSKGSVSYQLAAVLKNGRKLDLLSNLESPEVGFFIEQQIENWLDIPDRSVRGEIPR